MRANEVSQHIQEATELAASSDFRGSIAALLVAWKSAPFPSLALAIGAVNKRGKDSCELPTGRTRAEKEQAWVAAAHDGDPLLRGLLVDSLAQTRGHKDTILRVLALHRKRAPAPRLSARLGDFLEQPIYNVNVGRTRPFWTKILELLPIVGDPRLLTRAAAWPEMWQGNSDLNAPEIEKLIKWHPKLMESLRLAYGELEVQTDIYAPACENLLDQIPKPSSSKRKNITEGEQMLAAIYADPKRDDLRHVYSDFLQERGDPLGEFIGLQLLASDGKLTHEQRKRQKELIARHKKDLLGSLASKLKMTGLQFERGFVVAGTPRNTQIDNDPAWATMKILNGAVPSKDLHLPMLEELANLDSDTIIDLSKLTEKLSVKRLSFLQSSGYRRDFADCADAIAAFSTTTVLPTLLELTIGGWAPMSMSPEVLSWAWDSPCTQNLQTLRFPFVFADLALWLAPLNASNLDQVELRGYDQSYDWVLSLRRDEEGRLSKLLISPPRGCPTDDFEIANYGLPVANALEKADREWFTEVAVKMSKTVAKQRWLPMQELLQNVLPGRLKPEQT